MYSRWFVLGLVACGTAIADGPQDNLPDKVRRVPPPGIAVPETDRADIQAGVARLRGEIKELDVRLQKNPALHRLLPDVEVFAEAVAIALEHNEIHDLKEIPAAKRLLAMGLERAAALRDGKTPWRTATGLVVRGYRSKIDDSVQPYGLVIPPSYQPGSRHKHRLDLWWHGRGEKLSELSFLDQRTRIPGEFTPVDAFVLHPYGRYCNANKFAGEIDTFEAIAHVQREYPIDENRIVARGFSMGGAACWQFAVHYPDVWCAAAPGAGFSETPDFLKVFQSEELKPTWYEQKLWRMYDCTEYALNLFNLPTVAYSGEDDRQKQAADIMAKRLNDKGMTLTHIIGPKTGHRYHPDAKAEINRRIDAIVERGRNPVPTKVRFTTSTLRYNRCFWVTIDAMEKHWEPARIEAAIVNRNSVHVSCSNVAAFTLNFGPGQCPLEANPAPIIAVENEDDRGTHVQSVPQSDRSWKVHWARESPGKRAIWHEVKSIETTTLRKTHGLQGPIDDAFMSRFLFVVPTGQPWHQQTGKWVDTEMAHAVEHWRRQFRGSVRIKKDVELNSADISESNLILWGDPQSNCVLQKIIGDLPIQWTKELLAIGVDRFSSASHVAAMIYPNPLNPKTYVVLNSGFTFREYDYLNNARQVPKLPDFAVIDISKPVTAQKPGGIATAGFFDESWKLEQKR
jgi:pimeloyl-ACP methyl ester carboxylesterase